MAKSTAVATVSSPFTKLAQKGTSAPIVNSQSSSPYLILLHSQQTGYGAMVSKFKRSEPGLPIYVDGKNDKVMEPLKFIMTPSYYQCYAVHNSDGSLEDVQPAEGRCPEGKRDTLFAIILLVGKKNEILPARIRLQGSRAKGFKDAINYVASECEADDWGGRSQQHKLTVGSKLPSFCYAIHEASVTTHQPKDTSKGQKDYQLLDVVSNPTEGTVLKAIQDALKNDDFNTTLASCMEDFAKEIPQFA